MIQFPMFKDATAIAGTFPFSLRARFICLPFTPWRRESCPAIEFNTFFLRTQFGGRIPSELITKVDILQLPFCGSCGFCATLHSPLSTLTHFDKDNNRNYYLSFVMMMENRINDFYYQTKATLSSDNLFDSLKDSGKNSIHTNTHKCCKK